MNTIKITLRTKTMRKLDEDTCDQLRQVICESITCGGKEKEGLIWRLTYDPENICRELGFDEIDEEQARTIRSELVDFYRRVSNDWDYGRRNTPESEEEKGLWKALKGDAFAYDTVMGHIKVRSTFGEGEVERIIRCLNSPQEASQYGGVRSLGFRKDETDFLKEAANAMGKVLASITK